MITDEQIALVQSSFQDVRPIADAAGLLFYERVFTLAPEARAMFGDDLARQATRTMTALGHAVDGLTRLDEVAPFLVRLGARHVGYGVLPEHFDLVGSALLWTLEQGLRETFTAPVAAAWAAAWQVIRELMLSGMREAKSELALAAR